MEGKKFEASESGPILDRKFGTSVNFSITVIILPSRTGPLLEDRGLFLPSGLGGDL